MRPVTPAMVAKAKRYLKAHKGERTADAVNADDILRLAQWIKAEQNDLIIDLGAWVIDEACRQIAHWSRAGRPALPVSVNVSPRQVRHGSLLEVTSTALERHGVELDALEESRLALDGAPEIKDITELINAALRPGGSTP